MSDPAPQGVRCMLMRGGTSKGAYFLADDLPDDIAERDAMLLGIMGSPDPKQIDGIGGADPLTSKVAIIRPSACEGVDVDYLFLQVDVGAAQVSDAQNCGNILAGVGPFAIERGLVPFAGDQTRVAISMVNSGAIAEAVVATPGGRLTYAGTTAIDGVPGTHAPIELTFRDIIGSTCGSLLPTSNACDTIDEVACTLIDHGMPSVLMRAEDFGATGFESREQLESEECSRLRARIEAIRLQAGPLMNLGDVGSRTVPKMVLLARPREGGTISARSFIPHRAHASIGVLGGVSVASACLMEGSVAHGLAQVPAGPRKAIRIEHPSGAASYALQVGEDGAVQSAGIIRTARKLMDGVVFAPDR